MDAAVLPAPPALSFRIRGTGAPVRLQPSWQIGNGGEARVYALPAVQGAPPLVAKVHHAPSDERGRKLAFMVENAPGVPNASAPDLAWPLELLEDDAGMVRGFLMRRAEGARLFDLYNPATRRQRAPQADYQTLLHAGRALAAVFERLHAGGYVVGDVNESNILVGEWGWVTVVDTDSFQVREPDGTIHRSRVGKAEFTPPELQGMPFDEVDRAPEHDAFGLAVLLFQLLMEGTHPFAAQYPGLPEMPPMEWRIREGRFPYRGILEVECSPPRLAPPIHLLHPALRSLFHRCFVDGAANPAARPAAQEWRRALESAAGALVTCRQNRRHKYGDHLRQCPWCERAALLGGRDPFPLPGAPDLPPQPQGRPGQPPQGMAPYRPPVPGMAGPPPQPAAPAGATAPAVHIPTGAVPALLRAVPDDLRPVVVCAVAVGLSLILPFPFGMALGFALAGAVAEHVFPRPRQAMTALAVGVVLLFILQGMGGLFFGADDEPEPEDVFTDATVAVPITEPGVAVGEVATEGVVPDDGRGLVLDVRDPERMAVERGGLRVEVPLPPHTRPRFQVDALLAEMDRASFGQAPVSAVDVWLDGQTRTVRGPFDTEREAIEEGLRSVGRLDGYEAPPGGTSEPELRNPVAVDAVKSRLQREAFGASRVGGTVWLSLLVRKDGTADDVRVTRSGDVRLDALAREAGRAMLFHPATRDGEPIEQRMQVQVTFEP